LPVARQTTTSSERIRPVVSKEDSAATGMAPDGSTKTLSKCANRCCASRISASLR